MAQLKDLIVNGPSRFIGDVYATTFTGDLNGNANTATSANTAAALTGKTLVTASAVTTSNWSTYGNNHIPTMSFMAYWNGAYSGTSSNLTYCAQGTIIGSNNIGSQRVSYATTAGSCSGNAATATKATQDGNGNVITDTYLPLSGGTISGNIIASSTNSYNLGSNTIEFKDTYSRTVNARHLDASAVYAGDHFLYIGYGEIAKTNKTLFYYSTESTRAQVAEINSNGLYALTRFGVNGQNTSYNLYVNGSANITSALYENGVRVSVNGHTHTKSQITDFPSSLPANGGNADRAKFLETFQQNSTTNTYGSQYPIWAQWSDATNVRLQCTNYTVWTDKATYATTAGSAPASDVYAWAKAETKPPYNGSEVALTTDYSNPKSYKAIEPGDSVQAAIAKLEGAISGLENLLASI